MEAAGSGSGGGCMGDAVTVTNEDPYDEDPEAIMREVAEGARNADRIYRAKFGEWPLASRRMRAVEPAEVADRRAAIRDMLSDAKTGDIVVITGKGAERSIASKDGKMLPWSDREVVKEELAHLGKA